MRTELLTSYTLIQNTASDDPGQATRRNALEWDARLDADTPEAGWARIIGTLSEWCAVQGDGGSDETGYSEPSEESVRAAIDFARKARLEGWAAPTSVASTGTGGVALSHVSAEEHVSIMFSRLGAIEYAIMTAGSVQWRRTLEGGGDS